MAALAGPLISRRRSSISNYSPLEDSSDSDFTDENDNGSNVAGDRGRDDASHMGDDRDCETDSDSDN